MVILVLFLSIFETKREKEWDELSDYLFLVGFFLYVIVLYSIYKPIDIVIINTKK